jgi:hypothetical protein
VRLATFQDDGYELLDCVVRNAEAPTFEVPDMALLERLRAGQLVKLVFRFPREVVRYQSRRPGGHPGAERMWVRVDGLGPDGLHFGVLRNNPAYFDADVLKCDDPVVFELRHVASLDPDDYPSLASVQ